MINFMSNSDDIVWLAYKLKEEMGRTISINKFGLHNEILTGKYSSDLYAQYYGIDFNIKFSADQFLRINVGEIQQSRSYEEKIKALSEFYSVINKIIDNNNGIFKNPLAFYNVSSGKNKIPYLDWVFCNREEYEKELVNGTLFDDAVIEDLIIFDNVITKNECQNLISKKLKK